MEVTEASHDDNDWVDVMGKGIRVKSVVKCAGDPADMHTVVTCNLKSYFIDDVDHLNAFENLPNQVFVIGEMDALPSIELTLRHSRVGDIYWLRSSYKFAYGVLGRSGIPRESVRDTTTNDGKGTAEAGLVVAVPPNMDLEFYIEVTGHYSSAFAAAKAISLRNREDITLIDEQVVTTALEDTGSHVLQVLADTDLRRTCGNRWFSYGDYPKAGKAYAKGIEYAKNYLQGDSTAEGAKSEAKETSDEDTVENTEPEPEADDDASRAEIKTKGELLLSLIACLNNLTACYLSMKEYAKAKETCVQLLSLEPDNVKALIRASKASLALHEYEECAMCLATVQQLAPENPSLPIELNRLKIAKAAYHAREKQMAKNMASKLFPDLKKVDKPAAGKNQVESNSQETADMTALNTDSKVLNDASVGEEKEREREKEKGDVKADGSPIASKEREIASSSVPVPVPAGKDKDKDKNIILKGESEGSEGTGTAETETGVATPSALLMIVCSTAVLVLSLLIALYLK